MKKQVISTAMLGLLCTITHADNTLKSTPVTAQPPIASSMPATPLPRPVMNCDYPLPATITTVDISIINTWAEKAAVQSFSFNPTEIDAQLMKLKNCFTDSGWQGFQDAMDKSGNIQSIKTQHLTVTSQVDGLIIVNQVKENQWKVILPLQVVYQNDKNKLTQPLSIELLIGRKITGNLGILQIIAAPKDATGTAVVPEKTK